MRKRAEELRATGCKGRNFGEAAIRGVGQGWYEILTPLSWEVTKASSEREKNAASIIN